MLTNQLPTTKSVLLMRFRLKRVVGKASLSLYHGSHRARLWARAKAANLEDGVSRLDLEVIYFVDGFEVGSNRGVYSELSDFALAMAAFCDPEIVGL